jgi:hypothetical protein
MPTPPSSGWWGRVYYEDQQVDLVYRDCSVLDLIDLEAEA